MSLIVGNWKMHKSLKEVKDYCKKINKCKLPMVLCPPFVYLHIMKELLNDNFELAGQDSSAHSNGPYTGEVSAEMLKEYCDYVIIGHSERRHHFNEKGPDLNKKIQRAQKAGLKVILCVGESLNQRVQNKTTNYIERQIRESLLNCSSNDIIIAYEPIWAIGTGRTPSLEEIEFIHQYIKAFTKESYGKEFKVIYGGSVDEKDVKAILSNKHVDGVLVGHASLDPNEFIEIAKISDKVKKK